MTIMLLIALSFALLILTFNQPWELPLGTPHLRPKHQLPAVLLLMAIFWSLVVGFQLIASW